MDDPLSEILDSIRLDSAVCARAEMTAPWGWRLTPTTATPFYFIISGTAILEVAGRGEAIVLNGGDYVALPHGDAHVLRDSLSSPILQVAYEDPPALAAPGVPMLRLGGGGRPTRLVNGHVWLDSARGKPLLRLLPDVMLMPGEDGQPASWARPLIALGEMEDANPQPGTGATLKRVAEMFFLQAARAEITRSTPDFDHYNGLARAPKVALALRLMRANPGARWTLAELAGEVSMSRSAFAAAFTTVVGDPPMKHLTALRMARAAELLKVPGVALSEIAFQVGYESDIAFARGFKQHFGQTPGAFRQSLWARAGLPAL